MDRGWGARERALNDDLNTTFHSSAALRRAAVLWNTPWGPRHHTRPRACLPGRTQTRHHMQSHRCEQRQSLGEPPLQDLLHELSARVCASCPPPPGAPHQTTPVLTQPPTPLPGGGQELPRECSQHSGPQTSRQTFSNLRPSCVAARGCLSPGWVTPASAPR
uniref:Uncharacterized protein n=1 Tax=Molossus molossus TaxID=27622 RepID=A0A7J8HDF5_MOLMO|nr:hypothetical protein HJG59_011089 [Molossus molossus]